MGGKYSKVVGIYAKDFKLQGLDIVTIRSKIIGIAKKFHKSGIYFITKDELKWAFGLTDIQVYQCFQVFDFSNMARISCLDFWGTLTLIGIDSVFDKVNFCFKMMDLNLDGFLSFNDLIVLTKCITRGIARLRGYEQIPGEIIDKLIVSTFKANTKTLNESGEISMNDFRAFLLAHDHARAYISSLGTKVPAVDTAAIVVKRSNLQMEVAETQAEMARLMCAVQEINDDSEAFVRERGGDAQLAKISQEELQAASGDIKKPATSVEGSSTRPPSRALTPGNTHHKEKEIPAPPPTATGVKPPANLRASMVASLRNATKSSAPLSKHGSHSSRANKAEMLSQQTPPADHPAGKYFRRSDAYADADVFSDSRACRPAGTSRNLFGENFRNSLLLLWGKLPRDSAVDGLAALDEFTLMSLFDNVGVVLPFHHARACLQEYLAPSQTGLYSFSEVLRWYQLYGSSAHILLSQSPDEVVPNSFEGALSLLHSEYSRYCKRLQTNLNLVRTQRGILNAIDARDSEVVCRYRSHLRVVTAVNSSKPAESSNKSTSAAAVKDQNLVLKWVEFRNLSMKKPTNVALRYFFGHPEIIPIAAPPEEKSSAPSPGKKGKPKASTAHFQPKFKSVKVEEISDWRLRLQFTLTSNPFTNLSTKRPKEMSRIKLLSDSPLHYQFESHVVDYIEDFANLQAQDCLDFMNLRMERLHAEAAAESVSNSALPLKVFSSVVWFCVELRPHLHHEQELILVAALRNLFLSVPFHLRQHHYSELFVHGFNAYTAEDKGARSSASDDAGGLTSLLKTFVKTKSSAAQGSAVHEEDDPYRSYKGRRVVLVALFHETDHLQEAEKLLVESDVFASRAVHRLFVELVERQSLSEHYAAALRFDHYEDKLFGPQEGELGEEGMNPLKYAKNLRAQKKTVADNISAVTSKQLPREDLLRLCKELGCKDTGTMFELSGVVLRALQMTNELVGYGEMSQFGRAVVDTIFAKFKPSAESKGEYRAPSIAGKDYDSGMLLWEFNALLSAVNTATLCDSAEYKAVMGELELLLDKSEHLKVEGLANYYLTNGRLAADAALVGVGSLNETMKGRVTFQSTYEPDALASLLNLMGRNSIVADKLLQYMACLSALKDVKLEGELDLLGDLLAMLQHLVIRHDREGKQSSGSNSSHAGGNSSPDESSVKNWFTDLLGVLKTPGWLARTVDSLSEFLADGEDGVVPTMRQTAQTAFGKFDRWKSLFVDELVGKIKHETKMADEAAQSVFEGELQARIEMRRQQKQHEADLKAAEDKKAAILSGIPKAVPVAVEDSVEVEQEQEEVLEEESRFAAKQRREAVANAIICAALPPLSKHNDTNLPAELLQLKRDLIFLSELGGDPSVELSLQESKQIAEKKETFLKRIDVISELVSDGSNLLAAHSCALYDALRLFGRSVSSIGMGSKDFCARSSCEGFDILELLPEGLGEFSPSKQAYVDKLARAQQRKVSALAALERERLRRNMTDEDREKIRLEQLAAQIKLWEAEEAQFYAEACNSLFVAREERKSTAEIAAMIKQWETLMALKESRYTDTLQVAVSQNNVGCLLLEFYGLDHPLGSGSVYIFQAAADVVMIKAKVIAEKIAEEKAIAEAVEVERTAAVEAAAAALLAQQSDHMTNGVNTEGQEWQEGNDEASLQSEHSVRMVNDNQAVDEELLPRSAERQGSVTDSVSLLSVNSRRVSMAPLRAPTIHAAMMEAHEILPTIMILVNYVTVLIRTDSSTQLKKSFDVKNHVYDLLQLLSDKERERLDGGVINAVKGMDVFCFEKPRDSMEPIVREIAFHHAEVLRLAEEERQRLIDLELAAQAQTEESSVQSPVVLTKSQLRAEKKLQKAEQRKIDAIKRAETSQQRKKLYELIQSDQITAIFNARASKATLANTPKWGSFKDATLDEEDQGLGGLAAGLSSKPSVAKISSKQPSVQTSAAQSSNNTINSTMSESRDD